MAQVLNQIFKYYHLKFFKLKLKILLKQAVNYRLYLWSQKSPAQLDVLLGTYEQKRPQWRKVEARNMLYS